MATLLVIASLVLAATGAQTVTAHDGPAGALFFESFNEGWKDRWQYSSFKKYKGRFSTVHPEGFQDPAIQVPAGNVHYGMSTVLPQPIVPSDGLVVQYEVKFSQTHECGGAYVKLISQTEDQFDPKRLKAKTPFTIMFGPDRCGPEARVHVILNVMNPVTHELVEHHLLSAPEPKGDKLTHVYTLVLLSNNRFKVLIDGEEQVSGRLGTAKWGPPLQPPEEVPDPDHIKPDDWVEDEMMDDPSAVKPADWDDRRKIPDPHAHKPEGWLDNEAPRIPDPSANKPATWVDNKDGVWVPPMVVNPACEGAPGCGPWQPPMIKNPQYKGPWIPPQIKNPKYKGPWKQRNIPNPAYHKLESPLKLLSPITAVAFELWTTESGYTFDSILLGVGQEGLDAAAAYLRQTWQPRHKAEVSAAMKAARTGLKSTGFRRWAANWLTELAESRVLRPFKPQLQPVLQLLQDVPELAWQVVLAPGVLLVMLLVMWVRNRSKNGAKGAAVAAPAAAAADDDDVEEDGGEDGEWIKELRILRKAAKAAAAAAATPLHQDDVDHVDKVDKEEGKEEDEEEVVDSDELQQQPEAVGGGIKSEPVS